MVARTKLTKEGRVLIPAEMRRDLNLKPGDEVVIMVTDEGLRLTTQEALLEWARERLKDAPSVETFIAKRREEARREHEKFDS